MEAFVWNDTLKPYPLIFAYYSLFVKLHLYPLPLLTAATLY
jgi:hypothetical protein